MEPQEVECLKVTLAGSENKLTRLGRRSHTTTINTINRITMTDCVPYLDGTDATDCVLEKPHEWQFAALSTTPRRHMRTLGPPLLRRYSGLAVNRPEPRRQVVLVPRLGGARMWATLTSELSVPAVTVHGMNRSELIARMAAGARPDFLFFWGRTPTPDHAVGRWVCSQWYPIEFTVDGERYVPAEQFMMAGKARLFGDSELRASTLKFGQHPELRAFLAATGHKAFVEAAPRDLVWGIGQGPRNPRAQDPARWRGRNLLGFALIDARTALVRNPR